MTLTLKNNTQKHIVTSGNRALAAAGQELFTVIGTGSRRQIVYNVQPGQLVAYTITNGVTNTEDHASLAAGDIYELYIGVGVDRSGSGSTDDIAHLGIEHISGCEIREASASSPQCGGPAVHDFYFDCTQLAETYSVMVRVDDNRTQSFSPWNKSFAEFVGSVVTNDSTACDTCPAEHNCREVACKLADALNNELDFKVGTKQYPDWKGKGLPRPFFATRLHSNSYVYCLTPQTPAGSCEDCTYIDSITGVSINGTVYNFSGNLDPDNSDRTLIGQLDSIELQINDAFITEYSSGQTGVNPHAGSAYFTGTSQPCCPIQLHVNTCDDNFILRGDGGATIAALSNINPFTTHGTVDNDQNCIDCGDAVTQTSYPCGIRVIAEQLKGKCGCYLDKPLSFYGRKISLFPFGDGWKGKPWRTVEVQAMETPRGFGSWIQFLEYQQLPEGRGRGGKYSRSNINKGWANLPGNKARLESVTASCSDDYCSYYYKTGLENRKLSDEYGKLIIHSNVHIPSTDTTTITAWENFSDALIGLNPTCKVVGVIACTATLDCSAPTTPAPTTPAPATPAPVTPAPVTPAPATPAPVTPAPVTPAPVTPAPATPAPATPAPTTPAPV